MENYLSENKKFEYFNSNPMLQDAIERNLITFGEAMNLILKINPDFNISNARKIVDLRNRLTHGYDTI
ncbi:MAG: DUF86 domain-containing protein [Bacteroidia bacterium]|nr:DUF86 domain-containing protein [Bacteroidia bacterium]